MKRTSSTRLSDSDQAPKLTARDLRGAKLRVGLKPVTREQFATALREKLGKQRVSIMLDAAVIAFFKAKAGDRGGYQTLINQALHRAMEGEHIEATLRRVIREELHSA